MGTARVYSMTSIEARVEQPTPSSKGDDIPKSLPAVSCITIEIRYSGSMLGSQGSLMRQRGRMRSGEGAPSICG